MAAGPCLVTPPPPDGVAPVLRLIESCDGGWSDLAACDIDPALWPNNATGVLVTNPANGEIGFLFRTVGDALYAFGVGWLGPARVPYYVRPGRN